MNLEPQPWVDGETQVADAPSEHRDELRLWLRLMTCSTLIEQEIRTRLRDEFDFTLPRFDFLAQLDRAPDGLVLGEVSRRLMVSAGNVTAIVERLAADGYISREASPQDRRMQIVKLTVRGRRRFRRMAARHGEWIATMFQDLSPEERDGLMALLGKLKGSVRAAVSEESS